MATVRAKAGDEARKIGDDLAAVDYTFIGSIWENDSRCDAVLAKELEYAEFVGADLVEIIVSHPDQWEREFWVRWPD